MYVLPNYNPRIYVSVSLLTVIESTTKKLDCNIRDEQELVSAIVQYAPLVWLHNPNQKKTVFVQLLPKCVWVLSPQSSEAEEHGTGKSRAKCHKILEV